MNAPRLAERAWRRIGRKPSSIVFSNVAGTPLAAQTVRLDWDNGASLVESEAGVGPRRRLIVLGIRDHATLANTDIAEGYTFHLGSDLMRCVHVIAQVGQIECEFEANG